MNDAQTDLEQRSLRNVRALVDKLEANDRRGITRKEILTMIAGSAILLVVLVVVMYAANRRNTERLTASAYGEQCAERVAKASVGRFASRDATLRLAIFMDRKGNVATVRVVRSSGDPVLDGAAAHAVRGVSCGTRSALTPVDVPLVMDFRFPQPNATVSIVKGL